IIIIVLGVALGVSWTLWKTKSGAGDGSTTFANTNHPGSSTSNNPAPGTSSPQAGPTRPNFKVASPVVVEEYGDYQCPPCGQLYPELKQIEQEYGDQVQVVFHHFPLAKMHKNAVAAARAAEAARNQNRFWEMHDRLYRSQDQWKDLADPQPTF